MRHAFRKKHIVGNEQASIKGVVNKTKPSEVPQKETQRSFNSLIPKTSLFVYGDLWIKIHEIRQKNLAKRSLIEM